MDEYVDILDESGQHTGESDLKSVVHRKGLFHPTVHVWFYQPDARVLLQKRGKDKKTHPLLWDVSVAGHIASGEDVLEAAVREVEEEIGLQVGAADLEKIGVFRSEHHHGPELIDREFHHTFICLLGRPLSSLVKQDSEVEELALIPLTQLAEDTWGLARPSRYVPHETAYYKAVIKAIKNRL